MNCCDKCSHKKVCGKKEGFFKIEAHLKELSKKANDANIVITESAYCKDFFLEIEAHPHYHYHDVAYGIRGE